MALSSGAGCGANEPGPARVVLRYEPAVGATIRYHAVIRSVPGDVPGRTVSASGGIRALSESDDGARRIRIAFDAIHLAGEGGSAVRANGALQLELERDPLHAPRGAPAVEGADVAGAADVARAFLGEAITFPESAVGVGDTWPVPALEQAVLGDALVRVVREARLTGVADGVATIEVSGQVEGAPIALGAARVSAEAEHAERVRVRVADGLLVEHDRTLALRLRARLEDGTAIGERTHHTQLHLERVAGPMPSPATHDWRPDAVDGACGARLRAVGRRFERAPRAVDLGALPVAELRWHQAADGRDLDEAGPVIVGADAETFSRALAAADLDRAVVVYAAAPTNVDEAELAGWLSEVPSYLELRRLVHRPVDPPPPRASAPAGALAGRLREQGLEAWPAMITPRLLLCGSATEALEEHGPSAALRAPLQGALERCGCGVTDLADLEYLLDLRLGGPEIGWIPLARR